MGELIKATASDGHILDVYLAQAKGLPKGGIVLIQEIFGVNNHIKSIADQYASEGYLVGAPSLFDRVEPNIRLCYNPEDIAHGKELKESVGNENPLLDIQSTLNIVKSAGKVAVIGYCWGGTLTWLSACQVPGFSAAASYYGGGIGALAFMQPKCPTIFHFGENDPVIPLTDIDTLKSAQPKCPIYLYPAGHGFNCKQRDGFHSSSSKIALERTIEHVEHNIT
jgi:carboxymethylenebutenolidase